VGTHTGTNAAQMIGDARALTNGTLTRTLSFNYDAADQLASASDPDSSYAYSYDNLGRVLSVDNNGTAGVPRVILTSQYDASGNRTSLAASVAGTADFQNSYTYDFLNRLTRVEQTQQSGGNSVHEKRVDFTYNAAGLFTQIARFKDTDGGSANEVASGTFSYDTPGPPYKPGVCQGGHEPLYSALVDLRQPQSGHSVHQRRRDQQLLVRRHEPTHRRGPFVPDRRNVQLRPERQPQHERVADGDQQPADQRRYLFLPVRQ
jgi:YD repeat-containing protein